MDWQAIVVATGGAMTLFGTGLGVIVKSWVDNATGERKLYMDQLTLALQENKEIRAEQKMQQGQIHNLQMKIKDLSVAKMKLETENIQFRRDITDLQRQLRNLGHEPVVPDTMALVPVPTKKEVT